MIKVGILVEFFDGRKREQGRVTFLTKTGAVAEVERVGGSKIWLDIRSLKVVM